MEKENVYKKLQNARVKLAESGIKKSGKNKYSGYSYFEMADFLPETNKIFNEVGLCVVIRFDKEYGYAEVVNIDDPQEKILFSSPLADVQLKGAQAMQNMGAVQTYVTRYLYIQILALVECDTLDAIQGNDVQKTKTNGSATGQSNVNQDDKQIQNMVNVIKKAFNEGVISDEKQIAEAENYINRADIKGITLVYNWLTGGTKRKELSWN